MLKNRRKKERAIEAAMNGRTYRITGDAVDVVEALHKNMRSLQGWIDRRLKYESEAREPWTPFVEATASIIGDAVVRSRDPDELRIVFNSHYQVTVYRPVPCAPFGLVTWLSIKRRDGAAIHDWRDMQRIKNEVAGVECEAVEVYPKESRLVDGANQYHLFCFPPGYQLPFGFQTRLVSESITGGVSQRQWREGEKPADLVDITQEQFDKALQACGRFVEPPDAGG